MSYRVKLTPILLLILLFGSCVQNKQSEVFIKVETPARPNGQEDVVGLVTEKLSTVRIGFIGLGVMGNSMAYIIIKAQLYFT